MSRIFMVGFIVCLIGATMTAADRNPSGFGGGIFFPVMQASTEDQSGVASDTEIAPVASKTDDYHFIDGGDSTVMGWKGKNDYPLIIAVIGEKAKFRFVLGTGSKGCLLSRKVVDKLKLEPYGDAEVRGTDENLFTRLVKIDSIQIGNLIWYPEPFQVVEDKDRSKAIFDGFDGILGYEFLERFPVRVDFSKQLVTIFDPDRAAPDKPGLPLDINLDNRQAIASMSFDGLPVKTVIDLGRGSLFVLYDDWGWTRKFVPDHIPRDLSLYMFPKTYMLQAGQIGIPASFVLMEHRSKERQALCPAQAVVGSLYLNDYNLFIDYPNRRIYFDKIEDGKK